MPNKASELLNRLPSVAELLDKPPIRALASRWNRSVVAGGVRSFLDELRSDLERRAADVELPTVRELAERAARHVVALQQHAQRPAINATGRIDGPPWICAPLAEPALERLFSAHFTEGRAIDDIETLQRLGAEAGLDGRRLSAVLAGDQYGRQVRADEEAAREIGISGVPFYMANRKVALSGAHSVEVIGQLITAATDGHADAMSAGA